MSRAATGQDVTVWQGEHVTLRFTIEAADSIDLQNAQSLVWRVGDGEVKSVDDGVTAVEPLVVEVELTEASTGRKAGRYSHELRVIDVTGRPVTLATGRLLVQRSLHWEAS